MCCTTPGGSIYIGYTVNGALERYKILLMTITAASMIFFKMQKNKQTKQPTPNDFLLQSK